MPRVNTVSSLLASSLLEASQCLPWSAFPVKELTLMHSTFWIGKLVQRARVSQLHRVLCGAVVERCGRISEGRRRQELQKTWSINKGRENAAVARNKCRSGCRRQKEEARCSSNDVVDVSGLSNKATCDHFEVIIRGVRWRRWRHYRWMQPSSVPRLDGRISI